MGGADQQRILKALLVQHRAEIRLEGPLAVRAGDGTTTDVGEILEVDRPRRLSYTFHHVLSEAARKERPTKVSFNLEPHGKLVKLTLTHEDFQDGSVILDGISKGWPAILSSLKSLLESGQALAIPPSALAIEGFDGP